MFNVILNILLLSGVIFAIDRLMPGIYLKNFLTAIIVAVVYSIINIIIGKILVILAFPFMIITLGLFKFLINALMLWMTDKLIDDFKIDSIKTTLIASFFITISDSVLRLIF